MTGGRVRGLRRRAALVALTVVGLIAAGTTGAAAVWTVQAQTASTASTASLGLVQTWLSGSSLTHTYTPTATAAVGSVTLTNTGTRTGTVSVTVASSTGPAALRTAVAVQVGLAASCTTSATFTSSSTGTLASAVTFSTSLAAGASITVCTRTTMTPLGIVANAGGSLSASVAASIQMGAWTASAPPTAFSLTVPLSPTTVDPTGWYWLWTVLDSTRCIEADNPAQPSIQPCADLGPATASQELWQFATTTAGYFNVVSKADPTHAWAFSNAKAGQALKLDDKAHKIAEFNFISLADGSVQLEVNDAPGLCVQVSTTSPVTGSLLHLATCNAGVAAQKFRLQRYVEVLSAARSASSGPSAASTAPEPTASPAPVAPVAEVETASSFECRALSATEVSFFWTSPAAAPRSIVTRVLLDGAVTTLYRDGTPAEPAVHFTASELAPALADGAHTVEVQHSIDAGPWLTTGTGAIRFEAAAPELACG